MHYFSCTMYNQLYYFIKCFFFLDSPSSSIIDSNTLSTNVPNENSDFTVPEMGPENAASKVTCRVCQEMIDVIGKREQHVVKCNRCNEATVSKIILV